MDPEGFELAGRGAHSIWLLYENGSIGRVVCELLSTQNVGPRGMIEFDLVSRAFTSFRY